MPIVEVKSNTREKLEYSFHSLRGIALPGILGCLLLFFTLFMYPSRFAVQCVKPAGPATHEHVCSMQSLSMLGGSSLASMVLPRAFLLTETQVSMKYITGVSIDEYLHDDPETGDVTVYYTLGFEQDTRLIKEDLAQGHRLSHLELRSFVPILNETSDDADLKPLLRELETLLENYLQNKNVPISFYHQEDTVLDEILLLISLGMLCAVCVYFNCSETISLQASSSSLILVRKTITGLTTSTMVVPFKLINRFYVDRQVRIVHVGDGRDHRFHPQTRETIRYVLVLEVKQQVENGGDDVGPLSPLQSIPLLCGREFSDTQEGEVYALRTDLEDWIKDLEFRQRVRQDHEAAQQNRRHANNSRDNTQPSNGQDDEDQHEQPYRRRAETSATHPGSSDDNNGDGDLPQVPQVDALPESSDAASMTGGTDGAARAQNNSNPTPSSCCICLDETKLVRTVFIPCKHMVCCRDCAALIDRCPVCRVTIASTIHVYPG